MPTPTLLHYIQGETLVEAMAKELKDRDEALKQLQFNLQKAQATISKFANQNYKEVSY